MSNSILYEEPRGELIKEVYARFGLAYYYSECLHKALCHIYALASFQESKDITGPRMEEMLAYAFSMTLRQLKDEIKELVPEELFSQLDEGIEKRNFLAHHFWFERTHLMFSTIGLIQVIHELDEYSSLFQRLDVIASSYLESHRKKVGLTDDILQTCLEEVISGKPWEPFPKKRKLKKQERIVRVWECKVANMGKSLIFETDDGELWQLCDVGLGWTYYDQVEPDWQENKTIAQYLPANINPRPKDSKPWHYEFKLSKIATFWVRPGKQERTFNFGIRTTESKTE
jgi:hypothetical protein